MIEVNGLMGVRARAAYWQKRIELEKTQHRRRQLAMFAWAELARLVVREGVAAYQPKAAGFETVMRQQFAVSLRQTGSRQKKHAT